MSLKIGKAFGKLFPLSKVLKYHSKNNETVHLLRSQMETLKCLAQLNEINFKLKNSSYSRCLFAFLITIHSNSVKYAIIVHNNIPREIGKIRAFR